VAVRQPLPYRRFYRSGYDADRALKSLSSRLRHSLDLNARKVTAQGVCLAGITAATALGSMAC
jgi:hypothetical protein